MNGLLRVLAALALAVCPGANASESQHLEVRAVAEAITAAHGGMEAWDRLETFQVDRAHQYVDAPAFRFRIFAEYATRRMFQTWEPTGSLAWDGERAWSVDWARADRLTPRFVMSIGFYLVNLPWLLQDPETILRSVDMASAPHDPDRRLIRLSVEFEADMVRKPRNVPAPHDHFDLYADPGTHLIVAVMQFRTYAGQLDAFGADPEASEFVELFVPGDYVDYAGLKWPGDYTVYRPDGTLAARGQFANYRFDVPADPSRFVPASDPAQVRFDNSSSYQRRAAVR